MRKDNQENKMEKREKLQHEIYILEQTFNRKLKELYGGKDVYKKLWEVDNSIRRKTIALYRSNLDLSLKDHADGRQSQKMSQKAQKFLRNDFLRFEEKGKIKEEIAQLERLFDEKIYRPRRESNLNDILEEVSEIANKIKEKKISLGHDVEHLPLSYENSRHFFKMIQKVDEFLGKKEFAEKNEKEMKNHPEFASLFEVKKEYQLSEKHMR